MIIIVLASTPFTVGKKSNIVDLVKVKFGIYTSMSLYNGII